MIQSLHTQNILKGFVLKAGISMNILLYMFDVGCSVLRLRQQSEDTTSLLPLGASQPHSAGHEYMTKVALL